MTEKRCTKCKSLKKLDEFNIRLAATDGTASQCRECRNAAKRAWYAKSSREVSVSEKQCSRCGLVKSADEFPRHKAAADGLHSQCRKCNRERINERERLLDYPVSVSSKTCIRCGITKSAELFLKDRRIKDGLNSWCKHCCALSQRERYKNGKYDVAVSEKICKGCGKNKPASDFGTHKVSRDGLNGKCKECKNDARMRNFYSISYGEYRDLIDAQQGGCEICRRPATEFSKAMAIDHDHRCCPGKKSCGKCIRGILCTNCNAAIGLIGDSAEAAVRAVNYLVRYSTGIDRKMMGYELPAGVLE